MAFTWNTLALHLSTREARGYVVGRSMSTCCDKELRDPQKLKPANYYINEFGSGHFMFSEILQ